MAHRVDTLRAIRRRISMDLNLRPLGPEGLCQNFPDNLGDFLTLSAPIHFLFGTL